MDFFSDEQQAEFRENPVEIWNWIETHMSSRTERERISVYTTPGAALELGYAEKKSWKVLFVAIARALGIPARLDQTDGSPEYWKEGSFVRV